MYAGHWLLFRGGTYFTQCFQLYNYYFEGGDYSRAASNRGNRVHVTEAGLLTSPENRSSIAASACLKLLIYVILLYEALNSLEDIPPSPWDCGMGRTVGL